VLPILLPLIGAAVALLLRKWRGLQLGIGFAALGGALAAAVTLALGMNKTLFPLTLLAWSLVVGWNLLTIPTELDAGERGKRVLSETGLLRTLDERVGVERVMGAAATAQLDGVAMLLAWARRKLLPWMRERMGSE